MLLIHSFCSVICQKPINEVVALDMGVALDLTVQEESMVLTVSEPTYFTGIDVVKLRKGVCDCPMPSLSLSRSWVCT